MMKHSRKKKAKKKEQTKSIVWPQWWSFADMSQQRVEFAKKNSKIKIFVDLTFTDVHTDRQKLDVILWTKVVQFWSDQKMSFTKNVVLNWYYLVKFFFRKNSDVFDIGKWLWNSCEHLWKSNQKNIFVLLIFLLKWSPCWLMSAKLYHWGHTKKVWWYSFSFL